MFLGSTGAVAAESEQTRRQPCTKAEQQQQQQQRQQQTPQRDRAKPQGCSIQRGIPPVVDPTPSFLL
jgi:hypothetical protein